MKDALAVIDRHCNSPASYRAGLNLYSTHLTLCYADYVAARLVLRPLNFPLDMIDIGPEASPGEFIAGRVALIINEL